MTPVDQSSTAPQLFDERLARLRLTRRSAAAERPAFLREEMEGGLADRLAVVNRSFADTLILGNVRPQLKAPLQVNADRAPPSPGKTDCMAVTCSPESLPFRESSFDLVVSGGLLHWVNDLPGLLIQCHHCLRPDGFFLAVMAGGATLQELRQSLMQAEAESRGGAARRVSPFVDVRDGGALLQRAGFAMPVADIERLTVRYRDPSRLLEDLRLMGETAAFTERAPPLTRSIIARAMQIYAQRFTDAKGLAVATFDLLYLAGWARSPDQPKPLRPGSARTRLADALGVNEHPLR